MRKSWMFAISAALAVSAYTMSTVGTMGEVSAAPVLPHMQSISVAGAEHAMDEYAARSVIVKAYQDAWNARNASAVAKLFTNDGVAMLPGSATASGTKDIQKCYENIFQQLSPSMQFEMQGIETSGDLAIIRTTENGTQTFFANNLTVSVANRGLWVLKKVNGTWKIQTYMSSPST